MRQLLIAVLVATCAFLVAVNKAYDTFSSKGADAPHVELMSGVVRP